MQETYKITLKIRRYNPENERTWIQDYQLEAGRILRFTDLFRKINNELDPTLTWNSSCEHAQCGTCAVKINGKPLLACELLVENAVAQFETTFGAWCEAMRSAQEDLRNLDSNQSRLLGEVQLHPQKSDMYRRVMPDTPGANTDQTQNAGTDSPKPSQASYPPPDKTGR